MRSTVKRSAVVGVLAAVATVLVAVLLPLCMPSYFITEAQAQQVQAFFDNAAQRSGSSSSHTNNWAVLVGTSRFWFNYRHMSNTLGMYRTVKRLGIPDSNIILMLADDAACNHRNKFPGNVWASSSRSLDLYGEDVEVDYRDNEVTVETFIRVLTGRLPPHTPKSKRLESDSRSNIFLYMTGHGGDEFLKFQDNEEISAFDLADAIEQMWEKRRYNELFFMIDTCQANTMYSKIYSPNVLATGSSAKDQNSYSHHSDMDLGVAVIDRFTNHVLNFMESINKTSETTMQDLFDTYDFNEFGSDAGVRTDLIRRAPRDIKITDFFGGVAQVELTPNNLRADGSEGSPLGQYAAGGVEFTL
ncbi:glycosylphosphatidylinositol anchor biosynthesis [Tilletia horrida]|uniref:Glycosylphosphatidylinositol anchor biosynthesis n=1 Tax=Tilletia horrida TaxID=155126 RepID=A0AAN6GMD3_9BASI|nr:glycosylphosphatidylinositol anchor biosynthesis [Tilletia horrida]KAK0541148.1 glycosylphosphatidylinositol anchor biosynthesis [Tilletia horrida]